LGSCHYGFEVPANYSSSALVVTVRLSVDSHTGSGLYEDLTLLVSPYVAPNTSTSSSTTTTTYPIATGNTIPVPSEPDALVRAGNNIWVASCSANMVSEINSKSKQVIRELTGPQYLFECPDALVFDGSHIWVANYLGNSLTELNASTGGWIATLTGTSTLNPVALTVFRDSKGTYIWVVNGNPDINKPVLSEFNTSNGATVHIVIDKLVGNPNLVSPTCIVTAGPDIWVSDSNGFEFNATTGAFLRTTHGGTPGAFTCISYSRGHFWIANGDNKQLLEYNASTGNYVKTINNAPFANNLIFSGTDLFAVSIAPTDTVREYSTISDRLLRVIAKSKVGNGKGISALLLYGTTLWTANFRSNTVSEYHV